tara:strand:- start:340 stop:672 length:333 start_codon:yes stop_codon:yes gene_type:complete
MKQSDKILYWKKNVKYLLILLSVWFFVSFVLGVFFVDYLDGVKKTADGIVEDPESIFHGFRLGGFKLGFWIGQQGAVYVFVLLILIYVILMNRLDKKFNIEEKEITTSDH